MRADSLDLFAQSIVTCGREFRRGLMQRPDIGPPTVTMRLDQPDFRAAHGGVNLDAGKTEVRIADSGSKMIERLEKMNIGIPERVVSVEDEIQRISRRRKHLTTAYRRALRRAIATRERWEVRMAERSARRSK